MKHRILDILCCPECGGLFRLDIYKVDRRDNSVLATTSARCTNTCALNNIPSLETSPQDCVECYQNEIIEGKLTCVQCTNRYPIIGGVPRILPRSLLRESVVTYHHEFIERYSDEFPALHDCSTGPDRRKLSTLHAFSYQWTTFIKNFDYFKQIFLSFVRPFLGPEDFKDCVILEVGCGSGRPASVASSLGAEVVATDISEAVETAQGLTEHYPTLHVIQCDVYSLPLRPCFDFVYSVGVIQHLPEPSTALRSIAEVVPAGRRLVIWVYGIRELWYRPIDWLRRITVRLPFKLLHSLSILLALISEVLLLMPYRFLSKIPVMRSFVSKMPGYIYADLPFRENVLGWFDRLGAPITHYFSKGDVEAMLRNAGFREISIAARPGASASWVAQGTRE